MQYMLLGFAALLTFLLIARAYTVANPAVLARQLRVGAGVVVLAGAFFLVLRGALGLAMSLAALGSWLLWGIGLPGSALPRGSQKSPSQTSSVRTEYLEIELEHDTGAISGQVLKGSFAGRPLETLAPMELTQLWQDCRFADPQSAQILEAYLDRVHPSWREDMARRDGAHSRGTPMSREEALDILGLRPGATEEEIRRAHRELMLKLHPDRGGSTFLAAKINEAKDVLLDK